ncbi:MAG: histidine kinase [Clostridiaceae bacterium]|nr:histidine kinase [Clostridiaceae bacterium]
MIFIAAAINCLLTITELILCLLRIPHFILFIVLGVVELIRMGSFYYLVIRPLTIFEKALNLCINNDIDSEDALYKVPRNTWFINRIKILVAKCSNQKIRENSAIVFDKQAELTALQSQINPHFLCNTLESIRGQALLDGNIEIAKMMEALASFFRYSISRRGNFVTLRDELNNIKNYMMIQSYRFNNRFSLEIIIEEDDEKAYDYLIPRLILQPVVENAIYHGLEELPEGGKVVIEVTLTENILILTVSDNGKGMDSKTLSELNARIHSADMDKGDNGTGIALPNIHKRIQLLFGEEYGVNIYSTLNQGTDVEIVLPANYERIEE